MAQLVCQSGEKKHAGLTELQAFARSVSVVSLLSNLVIIQKEL